jgi:hypothetical protein
MYSSLPHGAQALYFIKPIVRHPLTNVNANSILAIRNGVTHNETVPKKKLPPEVLDYFAKMGRLGGLKGGAIRAARLTPEQRTESARKAVSTRWAKEKARNADARNV